MLNSFLQVFRDRKAQDEQGMISQEAAFPSAEVNVRTAEPVAWLSWGPGINRCATAGGLESRGEAVTASVIFSPHTLKHRVHRPSSTSLDAQEFKVIFI
ncbi:hypothetical protein SKAU_G00038940 [Synaphobranchus kaupii]|uniref:Uncharacterized protein n=1 Tax=Synaphobranchus kaupii TaxID=118154 RepID=A0A9Q1GF27_SYNKA|nr:hypothetical protein SKAU_G00038940 [Synaphobranchus kaupii]